MKALLATFGILAALGAAATPARADDYSFRRTLERAVSAVGATALSVTGYNGNVVLYGDGGNTVRVHAVLGARSAEALRALDVRTSRSGNTVHVEDVCPSTRRLFVWSFSDCDVELVVQYPRSLAVNLRSQNGNIVVNDPRGNLSLTNDNGNVTIAGAAANVSASNSHGNVRVMLARDWRGSAITLSTSAGNIHLRVPASFTAKIESKVRFGDIRLDERIRNGPVTVTASTTFGNVTVSRE